MSALTASTNSSDQDGQMITRERIYELLCKYVRSHGSNWSPDHMKKWYNFVHRLRLSIRVCQCFRIQTRQGILHLIPIWANVPGVSFSIFFQDPFLVQVRVLLLLMWRKQSGHWTRKRAKLARISLPSNVLRCVFSFLLPITFTLC